MQLRRKNKVQIKLDKQISEILQSYAKRKNISVDDVLNSLLKQIVEQRKEYKK